MAAGMLAAHDGGVSRRIHPPMQRSVASSIAAIALAVLAGSARAEGVTASRGVASGHMDFRIAIPAMVRVEGMSQPRSLRIAREDIARGYVDLDDATSVRVTSNSRSGFAISVAFDEHLVSRVFVRIRGDDLAADASGDWLHVDAPRMVAAPLRLGYRLFLAPGAREGEYSWPVALGFGSGA